MISDACYRSNSACMLPWPHLPFLVLEETSLGLALFSSKCKARVKRKWGGGGAGLGVSPSPQYPMLRFGLNTPWRKLRSLASVLILIYWSSSLGQLFVPDGEASSALSMCHCFVTCLVLFLLFPSLHPLRLGLPVHFLLDCLWSLSVLQALL